jgi:HK97 family phage portal protein
MTILFRDREERNISPLMQTGFGALNNWSGENVSESTALQVNAVMACVGLIADSVASLPLRALHMRGDRTEAMATPRLFSDPSNTVTEYELVHQTITSLALWGNAYIYVDRAANGNPIALTPLHPNNVDVSSPDMQGRRYFVAGALVPAENMLHLRWWTPPQAVKGISPIEEQKTTIGLAMAMERHLAQFYGEGATPSSVLETEADITEQQATILRNTWESTHKRHRKPAILTNGLKWRPVTTSAADQELNASRELQIAQVARIFRVQPSMIGAKSGDSQTYSNTEQDGQKFVTYTLMPWMKRLEAGFSSLLPRPEFVQFDTEAFLRADTLTRFRAHQIAISSGIRTPNEARAIENLEPYPGGDEFVMALPGAPMAGPGTDPAPVGVDADPPK